MTPAYRAAQLMLRLAVEAAWLHAWSVGLGHWLGPPIGPALPLPLLAAYLLVPAALVTALARRPQSTATDVATSVVGLVASAGGGLLVTALAAGQLDLDVLLRTLAGSRGLVAAVLALLAWWRGSRLAANRPSREEVEGQFRFGLLSLAGLLALVALLGSVATPDTATLVLPALVLVACGLIGVPLARIAAVSVGPRAEPPSLRPSGPWLGTLLGVVAGLLAITLLVAGILTVERLGAVLGLLLGAVSRVLGLIVTLVAIPAGYLIEWLVRLLRVRVATSAPEQGPQPMPPLDELLRRSTDNGQLSPELELLVDALIVLSLAAVIVVLLTRALARRQRWARESDGVEELRESVLSWAVVRELIAGAFRWLRRWLGRGAGAEVGPMLPVADEAEPGSIREVYREFLRLAMRLGFPRGRAETPLEFARRLEREQLFADEAGAEPAGRAELAALTATYLRTRYGPPARTSADPGPAARALARLRALWTR